MNHEEFTNYAEERLKPLLVERDPAYLTDVIILASTMTGGVIESWAEDTDREPQDLLAAIRARMSKSTGT